MTKLFATILEWFAGELTRKSYTGKHVLLIDCHDSHERARPLQMAMAKNIVLLTFLSHCTHLLQPLDISFFKALKPAWKKRCSKWINEEFTEATVYINKDIFITLMERTWRLMTTRDVGKNGWAKIGLGIDPVSGLLQINRKAVGDASFAHSIKYEDKADVGIFQSVHLPVTQGDQTVYENFDFDFSEESLTAMQKNNPQLYAMHLASKAFIMQQPSMVINQRTFKAPKVLYPKANVNNSRKRWGNAYWTPTLHVHVPSYYPNLLYF